MMVRNDSLIAFKAPLEDKERWRLEAEEHGISLGELIRRRMGKPVSARTALVEATQPKKKPKADDKLVCEHRLPPGTWCKACGQIRR